MSLQTKLWGLIVYAYVVPSPSIAAFNASQAALVFPAIMISLRTQVFQEHAWETKLWWGLLLY